MPSCSATEAARLNKLRDGQARCDHVEHAQGHAPHAEVIVVHLDDELGPRRASVAVDAARPDKAAPQRQLESLPPGRPCGAVGHARADPARRVEHPVLILEACDAVRVYALVHGWQLALRCTCRCASTPTREACACTVGYTCALSLCRHVCVSRAAHLRAFGRADEEDV